MPSFSRGNYLLTFRRKLVRVSFSGTFAARVGRFVGFRGNRGTVCFGPGLFSRLWGSGRPFRLQEREGSSDWKPRVRGRGLSLEGLGGEPRQEPGGSFLCRRASSGLLGPSPGVRRLRCGGPGSEWGWFRVGRLGSNPVVFIPRSNVLECKCSMLW